MLSLRRRFRALYDVVRVQPDTAIDFSMDTRPFHEGHTTWPAAMFSPALLVFNFALLLAVALAMCVLTRVGPKSAPAPGRAAVGGPQVTVQSTYS